MKLRLRLFGGYLNTADSDGGYLRSRGEAAEKTIRRREPHGEDPIKEE